ncbi:MAG: NUDIX domain-containing protein [Chloroflexi bacterium]|nr:NUDIX domain-containing protein [Chloroflexota bacterium]
MPIRKYKVITYITHAGRLLVFRQPQFPEAGIQVPGGTVEPGEAFAMAALREATEETGVERLEIVAFLGKDQRDLRHLGRDEVHIRHFFHLRCLDQPPERWHHYERTPSEGGPGPIEFELYWVNLPDGVPELIADMGQMLPAIL